jgi:hypothetical protein
MASTYSSLKIQLMATGENSGTWGDVTNLNLGTALEEAIVGSADVTFSSANVTLTLTDTNSSQTARNLRLNLTGTTGAARDLIVPAIEKVYIVNNGCAHTVTVKNSTGTGIAVPAGKTMYVYNNATNVVDAITHLTTLTLGTPLAIADGGTGSTTATFSGANITALNASNISAGTLAVARGGTGAATLTAASVSVGNGPSSVTFVAPGTTGSIVSSNGSAWVSTAPAAVTTTRFSAGTTGFTPSTLTSGDVTLAGTLAVANGGTGSTTATFSGANITSLNATNISAGTLAVARGGTGITAVGTSGNVITSNGTAFVSQAPLSKGVGGQIFTSNGTFTIPTGVTAVKVSVIGGGGGGSGGSGAGSAGGNSSVASGTQSISTITANGGGGGWAAASAAASAVRAARHRSLTGRAEKAAPSLPALLSSPRPFFFRVLVFFGHPYDLGLQAQPVGDTSTGVGMEMAAAVAVKAVAGKNGLCVQDLPR